MKYLRLVLNDEKMLDFMSNYDRHPLVTGLGADDKVPRDGARTFSPEVRRTDCAVRTARLRKCGVLITDGPYVETKEQLGSQSSTGTRDLK